MAKSGTKSAQKGKRGAEDDLEKLNGKSQKTDVNFEQAVQQAKLEPVTAKEEEGSSHDSSDSDEEETDRSDGKPLPNKESKVSSKDDEKTAKKESSDDESGEDSEDDEESEEEKLTPKEKVSDDASQGTAAEQPKTPVTQAQEGAKTIFIGNLSFKVVRADVESFFKDAGEIVDIRFAKGDDGRFRGFGHVEFASAEAAQKALELNGQILLDREIKVDLARERGERGANTPHSGKTSNSSLNSGKGQTQTIFVKGFDTSLGEDQIRNALEVHFGPCGEITRISIPPDRDTGGLKGMAYLDFKDDEAFNKALELNGSEMRGSDLTIEEANPRGESRGRFGGRSGGRRGGGRSGGGRRGGRDGGGHFGRRGRGRGGFGGRGGYGN